MDDSTAAVKKSPLSRFFTCGTSLCHTPSGRTLSVQIGNPADLSLNRFTIRLKISKKKEFFSLASLRIP